MFTWIAAAVFVVAAILVIAWLIHEIRMDRLYQQDRDDWAELTRPMDEPSTRWPPKNDI